MLWQLQPIWILSAQQVPFEGKHCEKSVANGLIILARFMESPSSSKTTLPPKT